VPQHKGIDAAALEAWFPQNVVGSQAPLTFTLIAGGHSNLTYRVEDALGTRYALRRPPLGTFPPGAHDVLRECRILRALEHSAVPVPRVAGACDDPSVTGACFYVMDWMDGAIIDRPDLVTTLLPLAGSRRSLGLQLIDALADLHCVDVDAVGLGTLGPRDEHLARLCERMHRVWQRTKTRDLPVVESVYARLVAARPRQRYTGLVHSDYRLGNTIVRPDGGLAAVLDWELAALGDVMIDVAGLLANWDEPDDAWPDVWMQPAPTRAGGFPTKQELLERYAARTGFDVANVDYYRAFHYWRIAVIAEGMKRRYETGALDASSVRIDDVARRVVERAQMAELCLDLAGA
jgi:aminoglycoside phosphotransferase (APT) family kinase protein